MRAFVTVGSTKFDALVQTVLSKPILGCLRQKGYTHLTVQCGKSDFDLAGSVGSSGTTLEVQGVQIEIWHFKPSLQAEYERADLVISHAGSGTILDVLRQNTPLIVVPNPTLLENHQEELADALSARGYLVTSSVDGLGGTIENYDSTAIVPFPPFDPTRFRDLLDEEMGFL